MNSKLLTQNLRFNYFGLIGTLLAYCVYISDPSMSGWYMTFATIPIFIIPLLNQNTIEKKVLLSKNKQTQLFYSLFYPALFFIAYLFLKNIVVPLMGLSMAIVNLNTFFRIEKTTN